MICAIKYHCNHGNRYTHAHTITHVHHTEVHAHVPHHLLTHVCTNARTHTHACTYKCMHTHTHTYACKGAFNSYREIHTYVYTNTHTYTTYIHAKGGSQTRPFTRTHLRWRVNHRNRSEVAVADSKHNTDDNGCQITLKDRSVEGARDNAKCKEWKEDKSEKNKDKDGSPVLRLHQGREGESTCKLGSHTWPWKLSGMNKNDTKIPNYIVCR